MRALFRNSRVVLAIALATFALSVRVAEAVDGQVIINQNRALAGISPCDAAGFPVTICDPGSYKLSGNLTVPNENTTAIKVTADDVTIDLNGFAILGPNVCTASGTPTVVTCSLPGTGSGIDGFGGPFEYVPKNTTVINGTVRGMGFMGVSLRSGRVERILAESNTGAGVYVAGQGLISECTARANDFYGLYGQAGSIISDSMAASNGEHGIVLEEAGGMASGNTSMNNGDNGIFLRSADSGYAHNVMTGNGSGAVSGGTNMGHNLCNGAMCP